VSAAGAVPLTVAGAAGVLALFAFAVPAARAAPDAVIIATARGEARLAVSLDARAGPVLAGAPLLALLGATAASEEAWVELSLARQSFRFLLGAPLVRYNDRLQPLAGQAFRRGDSLFLPLQFVTEVLPRVLAERYRWDPARARLVEAGVTAAPPPAAGEPRLPNGLRAGHVVAIDPGHGGIDPGNPGIYFPRGISEKDVTLQVGLLLREELVRRGIRVIMTRTTDTLIALGDRARSCTAECDLFVSLHINALERRPGYTAKRGYELWIVGEENTEDAERVSRMENEALRFEGLDPEAVARSDLDFILRDLQMNEYLRESARAADLLQQSLEPVHPGGSRGVRQSNRLHVLNAARRPAVLVELGYATNPDDARLLVRRPHQKTLAYALADAVVAYLLDYERKSGGGPAAGGGGRR
jgi:N-acetylmuramoyl-L-alanine amidase